MYIFLKDFLTDSGEFSDRAGLIMKINNSLKNVLRVRIPDALSGPAPPHRRTSCGGSYYGQSKRCPAINDTQPIQKFATSSRDAIPVSLTTVNPEVVEQQLTTDSLSEPLSVDVWVDTNPERADGNLDTTTLVQRF